MSKILLHRAITANKREFIGCHVQAWTADGPRYGKLVRVDHTPWVQRGYKFVLEKADGTQFELVLCHDSEVSIIVND